MATLTLRTERDKQAVINYPRQFEQCSANDLRVSGLVYTYTRRDGQQVALSYENEPGVYVVWTIDDSATGYTTFTSRARAIVHAMHCAQVVYTN